MFATKFLIRILTWVGTLPFFVLAMNIVLFPRVLVEESLLIFLIYSSTIIMFIAGMWWGIVDANFDKADEKHQNIKGVVLIWSVATTLIVSTMLFVGDAVLSLVTLAFFYVAQIIIESYLRTYNLMSEWLVNLRIKPMAVTFVCILAILMRQMGWIS